MLSPSFAVVNYHFVVKKFAICSVFYLARCSKLHSSVGGEYINEV